MYAWRCRAHRVRVAELGGPHPVREGRANCSMRAGRFGVVLPAGESACPHCWPAERDVVADCRLGTTPGQGLFRGQATANPTFALAGISKGRMAGFNSGRCLSWPAGAEALAGAYMVPQPAVMARGRGDGAECRCRCCQRVLQWMPSTGIFCWGLSATAHAMSPPGWDGV